MRDDSCGTGGVMLAFVVGGLVGAGLAMLLTPVSGPEARRKLREFKDDVQDRAEDYIDSAKERVGSAVSRGREFVDEKKSAISKAVDAGKEAYAREKEKA